MNLSEIVPLAKIEVALGRPVDDTRVQTADLDEALRRMPAHVFGIAASAWRAIVTRGRVQFDPRQMRRYLDHGIRLSRARSRR